MTVKQKKRSVSTEERTASSERPWTEAYGSRLRTLRKALGTTQKKFADMLGVKQSLVSAWERGKKRGRRPSSGLLLKIAGLSALRPDEVDWLITAAGLDPDTVRFAAERHLDRVSKPPRPGDVVSLEPLRRLEGSGVALPFPKLAVPNFATTKYLTVRDRFMNPVYEVGDVLLIDESERDPWELPEGECIAVYTSPGYAAQQHWPKRQKEIEQQHPKEEVERRRRTLSFPYQRIGLTVGWLRKEIRPTATVSAVPTPENPRLLAPGPTFFQSHGWFFLEAPWLAIHMVLPVRQPHHPSDVALIADTEILGRVVAWISSREVHGKSGRS